MMTLEKTKLTKDDLDNLGKREYWDKLRKGSYWIVTSRQEWDSDTCEEIIEQILKNQAIIDDIRKCTKSDIQNGKKTITLARLQTLLRGVDYETI